MRPCSKLSKTALLQVEDEVESVSNEEFKKFEEKLKTDPNTS